MSASLADQLLERRKSLITKAQEIAQKGVAEDRKLTPEERNTFDGMVAEATDLEARARAIAEGEQRSRELEESFRRATGSDPREQRGSNPEGPLAAWARTAQIGSGFDLPSVRGAERRALARVRAGLLPGGFDATEQRAMSATAGVSADGVYGQLWEFAVATSQILQAGADVINTTDGNTLPLPAVTAHATGASAAPNAPITASDAALGLVNLSATKEGYLTLVPSELVADTTFDLEGYLARAAGRELGKIVSRYASTAVTAGFTASGSTVSASGITANAALSDALIDLFHSVLPEYRTTASWLMNDVWAAMVRKARDGSGQYVWERSLVPGNPIMVDGKIIYYDPVLPTAKTNGTKPIYFGDFSALKVRIAGGLRFERSNEYAFGNDQIAYRALVRTGAVTMDVNAVKYLQLTA